ncbi:hypothetical protein PFFVO_03361 [Plasmodium falciparum Vietnam Oak-Knoll (FVO)]|uniref:Proteasome assembly chaperone 4 n=1 Tax=Plasmodium falciparum Vietnam Oak-Knoll (FVO) TaxID=1036723 RepID=A0A024V5A2_PLAFA|nr:hypothetical protein PFFVO_03361 [Plasmodium falciparum Vietnam Oak-Knoll (FVO)]
MGKLIDEKCEIKRIDDVEYIKQNIKESVNHNIECMESSDNNNNNNNNNNTTYNVNNVKIINKADDENNEKDKMKILNNNENNMNPTIITKLKNINHEDNVISYNYTLVSYKNYNIFFISHNGKFASWVYSYNVILPMSVDQETEIIFGERNYPYLEIFCSKFMKDHAAFLKYKPIIFAISIYNMSFNDTKILTQMFDHLSNIVMETPSIS